MQADEHERIKRVCQFIEEYATAMLSAGATTSRIERCVERISRRYNVVAELSLLPSRILLTVWDLSHCHNYSLVGYTHKNGIDLQITDAAMNLLAKEGYNPEFGARPVKRAIHRLVLNELSKDILAQKVNRDKPIVIDANGETLNFRN